MHETWLLKNVGISYFSSGVIVVVFCVCMYMWCVKQSHFPLFRYVFVTTLNIFWFKGKINFVFHCKLKLFGFKHVKLFGISTHTHTHTDTLTCIGMCLCLTTCPTKHWKYWCLEVEIIVNKKRLWNKFDTEQGRE